MVDVQGTEYTMNTQVIVRDDIEHYSVVVGVAPGVAADRFRKKFQTSDEVPCFLNDYLYGVHRDTERIREYRSLQEQFPSEWLILGRLWSSKYELMDWLVEEFDAEVDWPEYQAGLDQLRARRERLRQWRVRRYNQSFAVPATHSLYPKRVIAAYAVLGCAAGANLQAVNRAYKQQCLQHHPDTGGSHEAMTRLNKAREILRTFLSPEPGTAVGSSAS